MFLSFLSALSQTLSSRTAIVFAGDLVTLSTPDGPRLVYGAYYPNAANISLSSATSALNATLTFPDYCSAIGLSNQPNFNFRLPISTGIPERPFANICIWFHSTPANVSFSDHVPTNNTLQLEEIDGDPVEPTVLKNGARFEFQHDVLLRWVIVSPEEEILFLPELRIDPAPGYPPEQTFSTFFVVDENVTYFDPPPPSDSPEPTESPLATEAPSESESPLATATIEEFVSPSKSDAVTATLEETESGIGAGTIGLIVLVVVGIVACGALGFFGYRWYMGRKGNRPSRVQELPNDEPVGKSGEAPEAPSSGLFVPYPEDDTLSP